MPGPLVLVAPNAFKGSLSAPAAARAIARGVADALPAARVVELPVADGGDGLIDAVLPAVGGRLVKVRVKGPLGEARTAAYALLDDGAALIEMARASGLALVPEGRRDALGATSYGVGQLVADALGRGVRKIVVGLGGSATNDGGAGMAQALGARLLDAEGRALPFGAEALLRLARIEWKGVKGSFFGVSDVTNPLLGPRGSARVFGPQKGAGPREVRILDKALRVWARRLKEDLGRDVAALPGAGAAGGLGAGLLAFLRARLLPGAAWVLGEVGAERHLRGAALLVTGEGRLDRTSLYGKAPVELARLARERGIPAAGVCGLLDEAAAPALKRAGLSRIVSFEALGAGRRDSLSRAGHWARRAGAAAAKALLVLALLVPAARAADPSFAEIDRLYLHRHQGDNLERSLALVEERLKSAPDDAGAHWRKGRALVRLGELKKTKKEKVRTFKEAEASIRRSIELEPKVADSHFWLGLALGRQGQVRGVLKALGIVKPLRREMEEVLRLDPKHGGAHHVLGEMLMQLPGFAGGDDEAAVAELEKAIELSPGYTAHYAPMSEAYLEVGRKADAAKALRACLAVTAPDDPAEFAPDQAECRRRLEKLGEKP